MIKTSPHSILIFCFLLISSLSHANADTGADIPAHANQETRLQYKQIFTEIPTTSKRSFYMAFSTEALPTWGLILGSTTVLVYDDEAWLAESKRIGRKFDWDSHDKTETKFSILGKQILRLPTDKGSSAYFLGDGWLHMSIAAGFLATGHFQNETKPHNVGIQMIHSMVTSTIYNQTLKRSFGRETPGFATKKRGALKPFPTFKEYGEETAKYDAMPSGHIMTVTSQFTIFHLNYPEYAPWTFTVGAIWETALMIQMVNNGVHWWSDYPLGIAMGYLFGRQAYDMGKSDSELASNKNKAERTHMAFYPYLAHDAAYLNWTLTY